MALELARQRDGQGLSYHLAGSGQEGSGRVGSGRVGSGCVGGGLVVLLHGVGLRLESWTPQIEALAARYQVVAFDLPGHGQSARLTTDAPLLRDYAAVLATSIDALSDGRPVYLAGHSLGALITVEIARRYPQLCFGFCALSAIHERSEEARQAVMARAKALRLAAERGEIADPQPTLQRWFGEAQTPELAQWSAACRAWLTSGDALGYAQAYQTFAREYGPTRAQLADTIQPALFATGALDPNSTPGMSQAAAEACPRGQAAIIAGAAHMVQLTHAEPVTEALIRHIENARLVLGGGDERAYTTTRSDLKGSQS